MASWDSDLLLSARLRKANQYAEDESRGEFIVVCGKTTAKNHLIKIVRQKIRTYSEQNNIHNDASTWPHACVTQTSISIY